MLVNTGLKWHMDFVEKSHFYTSKEISTLMQNIESTFTYILEQGDHHRAMKRLRVPSLNKNQTSWTSFKLGLFFGFFTLLFAFCIYSSTFRNLK